MLWVRDLVILNNNTYVGFPVGVHYEMRDVHGSVIINNDHPRPVSIPAPQILVGYPQMTAHLGTGIVFPFPVKMEQCIN